MAHNHATGHARAFLKMLDPTTDAFCFRTFDDGAGKRSGLARTFDGSLDQHLAALAQLNERGAGVFVVVNDGGQTKAEIRRVRVVFADTDGAPMEPIRKHLKPHLIVRSSPGKYHLYWLVAEGFPLAQFTPTQAVIAAKFGTDRAVKDLSRVMRLPGFDHCKTSRHPVRVIDYDARLPRYTANEILSAFGVAEGSSLAMASVPNVASPARNRALLDALRPNPYSLEDVRDLLRWIDPSMKRDQWMKVGFALAEEYGEAARELFIAWSRGDLWDATR